MTDFRQPISKTSEALLRFDDVLRRMLDQMPSISKEVVAEVVKEEDTDIRAILLCRWASTLARAADKTMLLATEAGGKWTIDEVSALVAIFLIELESRTDPALAKLLEDSLKELQSKPNTKGPSDLN